MDIKYALRTAGSWLYDHTVGVFYERSIPSNQVPSKKEEDIEALRRFANAETRKIKRIGSEAENLEKPLDERL